jgi:hypothetical protein
VTDHEHSSIEKAARALDYSYRPTLPTNDHIKKENISAGIPGRCTSHINHHCSLPKDHEGLHRVVGTRLVWSNQIETAE